MRMARECRAYGKGKRRQMADTMLAEISSSTNNDATNLEDDGNLGMDVDWNPDYPDNQDDAIREILDIWDKEDDHPYHFVDEEEDVEIGQAGLGPSSSRRRNLAEERVLDELDEEQIFVWNVTAGKVIRVDKGLHHQWRKLFSRDDTAMPVDPIPEDAVNPFAPFASELDWRVACWVVKDKIGHKAFDRFLAIPGVCLLVCQRFLYI